ncbi:MAG: glycosyltransferase family 4 protein [Candidatus Moranbacteria bacterium]|nr:glycosyltransferase family 4 protein [Candidatus Moranbacteria bacterium]
MKRILFFNYEYPPLGGGAANATKHLLLEYAKRDDVVVDLITSSISKKYEEDGMDLNIFIHKIPIGKNLNNLNYQTNWELIKYTFKAYFYARKLIKKNDYDLTHSFFAVPCGFISLLLTWQYKIPYIISPRGADVPGYSERFKSIYKILTPLIKLIWKNAKFVINNSKGLTELAKKTLPEQKFEVIFNGVDTNLYRVGERTKKDREKEFIILCASRLSKRKGFKYAINGFAKIAEKYPQVKIVFAGGDGGAMDNLKKQVSDLNLNDRIKFTGHYNKKQAPLIYQNADVFVMPSLNEGMSNNLLEALASGLPVLMTPVGGAEELITDGENGFLIKTKNSDIIANKLEYLIENLDKIEEMGKVSRKLAEQMSWKVVADDYVSFYERI